MNQLPMSTRKQMLGCICEGMALRATARLCDVSITTVMKFLVDLGEACQAYQDRTLRGLACKRIEADEIWAFIGAKEKNLTAEGREKQWGTVWTWVAMCAESRLAIHWLTGDRGGMSAYVFLEEPRARVTGRPQITTDGHSAYLAAMEMAFGEQVDYSQLVKNYGLPVQNEQVRYSPAVLLSAKKVAISGNPDLSKTSTSYAERLNLTLRMHGRRFTRLTNAHSKKLENHKHGVAIFYMIYNFCKIHTTLRCTPAMQAGVSNHVWELEEVISLLDQKDANKAA
jgi:IS1 family transposase